MYIVPIKGEHLVEKRHVLNEIMWSDRMTMQSLKFLSLYLSRINARDPDTRRVRFAVKEFARVMEFKGNFNREYYKATVNRLLGHVIHRDLESGGMHSFQLFFDCRLDRAPDGDWYVEMEAHPAALPLMFEFKDRYFTYKLWNVLRLKSYNHLRMYEILKQHEKHGTRILPLDKLKELLGIDLTDYPRWDNFKSRVLNSCQKALAEKTDIKFTYEPTRSGRGGKVTGVKFVIEKNTSFDGQITFDEFLGYTSDAPPEQSDNFQLTFDELEIEPKQIEVATIVDKPTSKRKKPPPKVFTVEEKEVMQEYAAVCQNQFSEKQTYELYEILTNRITERRRIEGGYRKAYLQEAYAILGAREQQEVIKHRFAYLKSTLQNVLKERTLENENNSTNRR